MTANAGDVVALARLYAVIGSFLAHAPGALGGDTRAALEDARARLGMDARRIEQETKMSDVARRMQIAGASVLAVKAEAEAEGIPMNDGGAYRLAYVAVGDAVQQLQGAVELLREYHRRGPRPFGGHAPYDLHERTGRFLAGGPYEPHPATTDE